MAYTFDQQVFCLNTLSNLSNGYTGSASQIAAQANTSITNVLNNPGVKSLLGNWSLVWGPVVVAAEGKALNTMYIAHNADTNQHVVAIAGTDSKSVLDWLLEDFYVVQKVDWPYSPHLSPMPMMSKGTSIGLSYLVGMAVENNGTHVHARDYLQSVSAIDITVCGHSLGGALSPAYALYLNDTRGTWAKGRVIKISCQPAAGATPGDKAFSDYYTNQLGANTKRVWNAHDVVPHAFQTDMLKQIKTIFEPHLHTPEAIKIAIDAIIVVVALKGYTQLMPAVPGFEAPICNKATDFMGELLCQHICAYADHFQISGFQSAVQQVLKLAHPFFTDGCN